MKVSENDISKNIVDHLNSEKIFKSLKSKIGIATREQILIGTTCGVIDNKISLIFQSAEQDIVIFLKNGEKKLDIDDNNFMKRFSRSIPENKILIPLLIFEVKHNSVITHSVRNYSEIARSIKYIFPFCMYNLLLLNFKNPEEGVDKIYMSSKNFNQIIYHPDYYNKHPEEVAKKLLDVIKQHLDYLKKDEFFRLKNFLK